MNLKPEELEQKGYALLDSLTHTELIPFVKIYLKKRTAFSTFYYIFCILSLAAIGLFFGLNYNSENYTLGKGLNYISYGCGLAFLLLPVHEVIHAIAYKSQGALNTSYDANLKKLYFMAIADRFVANKKEFQIVALAPFITISVVLIVLLFFANNLWQLTLITTLAAHASVYGGDFALLSYFQFHKDKEVFTYDDKEKGISYFYEKIK